jgi:NAD(P)H dehydrogenase (quinone)
MIWVGQAELPTQVKGVEGPDSNQINRLGSSLGLMTQSNNDSTEIVPPKGDLETARIFGQRVAEITAQFVKGK